jgi:hypothetical protein
MEIQDRVRRKLTEDRKVRKEVWSDDSSSDQL